MGNYSIKDLEHLSGIKAHTLRVWERRYGLIKPGRSATNRRFYSDGEMRKLISVSILYQNGFRISDIAKLSSEEIDERITSLSESTGKSNNLVDTLLLNMADLDEDSVNELLMRSIMVSGVEKTFSGVVFPLLKRVGVLWQTGSADVGSEHFISNLIRQRLISAIDSIPDNKGETGSRVLLFLPEDEYHEIGLLFYNYIIRKLGYRTLYLGQSTPLPSAAGINNKWKAEYIVTGLMTGFPDIDPEEYLLKLCEVFPGKKIVVTGMLANIKLPVKGCNILAANSAEELRLIFSAD